MQKKRKLWNNSTRNVPKVQHEHKLKKIELVEKETQYKQFVSALSGVRVELKDFFSWVIEEFVEGNQHLLRFVEYKKNQILERKSSDGLFLKKPRELKKKTRQRHVYEKIIEHTLDESRGTDSYLAKDDIEKIFTILEMDFDF